MDGTFVSIDWWAASAWLSSYQVGEDAYCPADDGCATLGTVISTKQEGSQMGIVKSIRNLAKNADQALLEEYGLVDETGACTKEGARTAHYYVLKHYREEILEDLKKLKAKQDADAKKHRG